MSVLIARRRLMLTGAALLVPGMTTQRAKAAEDTALWVRPLLPRPLRLVVAYPPGGVSATLAHVLAEELAAPLGVQVIVDYRAGDGGSVAMGMLARAAPDGTTLVFSAITPLTVRPLVGAVAYDPLRDIAPVAGVMHTPLLLVGTPALPFATLADTLRHARAHPGRLRWASSGIATTGHLVMEQVSRASGTRIIHVPYKGGGQQISDALGGQFELLSTNVSEMQLRAIAAGQFKPLAVGAPARLPVLPDVPTFAELGFGQANLSSLFGVFAPGGTPAALLSVLNRAINTAVASATFQQRLAATDNLPAADTREAFVARIRADFDANRAMLQAAPLRAP
jgi:tripartite-type tricarboxylate transporter receptor subunit TctC